MKIKQYNKSIRIQFNRSEEDQERAWELLEEFDYLVDPRNKKKEDTHESE